MIKPTADRVIVRMAHKQAKVGSLYIPTAARYEVNQGRVEAIGPEVTMVKPGDHVVFDEHAGVKLPDGSVLLEEENLICLLEDE